MLNYIQNGNSLYLHTSVFYKRSVLYILCLYPPRLLVTIQSFMVTPDNYTINASLSSR